MDGRLSARYWTEAVKEKKDDSGLFYYWNGERPLDASSPLLYGTGEIRLESADRGSGYWATRADTNPPINMRTSGVYLRANPEDLDTLDGRDERKRGKLIAERMKHWKALKSI